jgi:hypothetical protein
MQSQYNSLTPCERVLQDKWAKKKADTFAPCPAGFAWERYHRDEYPGYLCGGGAHFMSDGILAEGIPGLYVHWTPTLRRHHDNYGRKPHSSEYFS